MAIQLGYDVNDPNNPNNKPYDFGLATAPLPLSGGLAANLEPFVPSRIDSATEGGFGPGTYETQRANYLGGLALDQRQAAQEQQFQDALDMRQRLRDEETTSKKRGGNIGTSLKHGTEKVPGKGDGTKDTVPAKLAPGEAVLNKAAAEFMGRGLIKKLNQMGMHKMGMMEPDDKPGHHKCGTSKVQGKK